MSGIHAFLPPSGAAAWVACAMWPTMNATFPDDDTEHSKEGDAAHWVAREMLEGRVPVANTLHSNGSLINDEMVEGAEVYFHDVTNTLGPDWGFFAVVEKSLPVPSISEHNGGTPDLRAWVASRRVLYVWDYKYGHSYVEAFENWQLINYVAGILDGMGVNGYEDQDLTVVLRIVQPRSYHRDGPVREWIVRASDLRGYFNRLRTAAEEATGSNPKSVVGPHCEFCPGRHACEALQGAALSVVDRVKVAMPLVLDEHAMGVELRALHRAQQLLEARITGLSAQVEAGIRGGRRIPFFAIEGTVGRLEWLPEKKEEAKLLGDALGTDLRKPADLITPTQAINQAGIDEAVIAQYTTRKRGTKLIADNNSTARKVFGK